MQNVCVSRAVFTISQWNKKCTLESTLKRTQIPEPWKLSWKSESPPIKDITYNETFLGIEVCVITSVSCNTVRVNISKLHSESRSYVSNCGSAGPKRGCLNVGAWSPQESGRKAPLSCNPVFSMLHCSFPLAAAQLLVEMTSALQKGQCCSATSAAQHSENCSATSVFACGMLQGRGLEEWGLGLAEWGRSSQI